MCTIVYLQYLKLIRFKEKKLFFKFFRHVLQNSLSDEEVLKELYKSYISDTSEYDSLDEEYWSPGEREIASSSDKEDSVRKEEVVGESRRP